MRDTLKKLATFDVELAGVALTLKRRTAKIMVQIVSPEAIFGQMAQNVKRGDFDKEQHARLKKELAQAIDDALPIIVVAIDGEPVPEGFDFSELDPIAEAAFAAFLDSGISVDPTKPLSQGGAGG